MTMQTKSLAGDGATLPFEAFHRTPDIADWRVAIPQLRRKLLRIWLWSVALMTFGVLVVGGITRLTHSGLSIVTWKPLMGIVPPLSHEQWQHTFDLYRQFPEYQTWRQGMSLAEFKFIFFWEYLHRLLARTIGLVFLVPFLLFWLRGWLTRPLLRRTALLFGLGALQTVLGWLMVNSGVEDRPSVSHYRLAAHLTMAFLTFGWSVWLARDLSTNRKAKLETGERRLMLRGLRLVGLVLGAQIVWGAFVAGLKAGQYYPTFPLMAGQLVPPDLLRLDSDLLNFVANPSAVQWIHRVLGTLLAVLVVSLFLRVCSRVREQRSLRFSLALMGAIVLQYALG